MSALPQRRVVAVLSFALEANVFNPVPRRLKDFQVLFGEDYAANERQAGFVSVLRRESPWLFSGIDVRFVALYRGFCGGLIPKEDFESMKQSSIQRLAELGESVAGVFLDLHGAMGASGSNDAEAELVEACRACVGPDCLISASFDLHGNISERLLFSLDMMTAYRTMPHVDMEETKKKGLRMLLYLLQTSSPRPIIVFAPVPAIISGDTVFTTEGHGKEVYAMLPEVEKGSGVLDASFFVGHQHADEARVRAAVVLTGFPDAVEYMRHQAVRVAQCYWDRRSKFDYLISCPLLEWDQCIDQVHQANSSTVLLGDFGDNLCAGASGDVPFVLRKLIAQFSEEWVRKAHLPAATPNLPEVLVAGLIDPGAVEQCCKAEVNSFLDTLQVGAALTTACGCAEDFYGEDARPIELRDVCICGVFESGNGRWAVIKIMNVTVLLQERPWAFFSKRDFRCLPEKFQPHNFALIVIKLGGNLEDLAREIGAGQYFLANTPGATTEPAGARPNLQSPIWPLSNFEWNATCEQTVICSCRLGM